MHAGPYTAFVIFVVSVRVLLLLLLLLFAAALLLLGAVGAWRRSVRRRPVALPLFSTEPALSSFPLPACGATTTSN